LKQEDNITNK